LARYLYAWMSGLDIESVMSGIDTEVPFVISIIQRQVSVHSCHSGNMTNKSSSALCKAFHKADYA